METVVAFVAENHTVAQKAMGTLVLLAVALLFRSAALGFIRKLHWTAEAQRLSWHLRIRHLFIAILAIGVVIIWASQLRNLAISAIAVAAAIAIATKELLLCLSGAFVRAATEAFSVGDRVEIGGVRGDVVSYGLLGTTLLEIGPAHQRTGRAVIIPNSVLVSERVINETFTEEYVLHMFPIPMEQGDDWERAEEILLDTARALCGDDIDRAREYMDGLARQHGLPRSSVEPRVTIHVPEAGKLELLVRVPAKAREKGLIEQSILREFLRRWSPARRPERTRE